MAESLLQENGTVDPELMMLINNKTSGYNYRFRRQEEWLENYTLYRDRVIYNRLTQRQTVNLPMMKTVLRTLLKDVDDLPEVYLQNLDNDKETEVLKNEYWKDTGEYNNFEILDLVDKKQVFHFGRSFDQWQVVDGRIKMTIIDPHDILVSRFMDPTNIHSSRFLIHQHIFTPLSIIEADPNYDQKAVQELKTWHATEMGLVKAADNQAALEEKNRKMAEMGVLDVDNPILGEAYVELTQHFVYHKEEGDKEEEIYLYVEADQYRILLKKKLEDIVDPHKRCNGWFKTHYPYNTWADDVDMQDFWTDGIADIVRTPNKILNTWFSQMVEGRTLRSFGMMFYNSNMDGFVPQTYEPKPFGWYGIPVPQGGNISDVMQRVDIPDLKDSLDEMEFVITMVQNASGATQTEQGATQDQAQQITLGEVQLALSEAKERIKGMSKFYTKVWEQRGDLFVKLVQANYDRLDDITVYKEGRITNNIFEREIRIKELVSNGGYRVKVWNKADKDQMETQKLQKLSAVVQNIPDNPKLQSLYQKELLEWAEVNPDDAADIMKIEDQKRAMEMQQIDPATGMPAQPGMLGAGGGGMPQPGIPTPQPQLPQQVGGVK